MKIRILVILLMLFVFSNYCDAFYNSYKSYGGQTMYKDNFGRGGFNNPSSAMISSWINNDIMNMGMRAKLKKMGQQNQQGTAAAQTKPADYRQTDFSGSRKTLAEQFVKQASGLSPAESKELLKVLNDGVIAIEKEMPRKNNIAYAMTVLLATAININKRIELSDADAENFAQGINNAFGSTPEWKKAPAKEKQVLYESMLLTTVLMIAGNQAEDQESKDMATETAKNVLASFGVAE